MGDIEGLPFLEAIREFALEAGPHNVCFIHVTYIPFIKAAGELKTKPSQQSVAKLREIGLAPNLLVCRTEHTLDKEIRQKLSVFCNVPFEEVIEEKDVDHSIYEVPLMLQRERMDDLVCRQLQLDVPAASMGHCVAVVDVNDLGRVKVLAASSGCDLDLLERALRPNPAGNANERTPLVVVRPRS